MTYSKALALEFAALNVAAYDLADTEQCTLPAGYTPALPICMAPGARPRLLQSDTMDCWGFATTKPPDNTTIIIFRGTQDLSEWGEDGLALPCVEFNGYRVHKGFYEVYSVIRPALVVIIKTCSKVIFTGHSLGAAIATLAWLEFRGDLFTFAGPRVGDDAVGKALWDGQIIRVVNHPDVVPRVPSDPPFRHGGFEQEVSGPYSILNPHIAHSLASYVLGINKQ